MLKIWVHICFDIIPIFYSHIQFSTWFEFWQLPTPMVLQITNLCMKTDSWWRKFPTIFQLNENSHSAFGYGCCVGVYLYLYWCTLFVIWFSEWFYQTLCTQLHLSSPYHDGWDLISWFLPVYILYNVIPKVGWLCHAHRTTLKTVCLYFLLTGHLSRTYFHSFDSIWHFQRKHSEGFHVRKFQNFH